MDKTTILLLTPIILIQLILMIINLVNISKKSKTKYLSRVIWVFIVILTSYIGNICYLILESGDDGQDDSN
ncbi:MAG: PLDc N-terminal domain-containing protein [Oscillospiraceae bacterium]|nr:PLDc N-terminal domain-containing protein [Oscillospiraceae bacterium]